ncbi:MAG: YlcI/YnfO family protein [Acidimicrobiales bacterium]
MRVTLRIDDELLEAAKRWAREQGVSLGTVVEAALRRELSEPGAPREAPAIPVFTRGTGPRPGVDVISASGLSELVDDDIELDQLG